MVCHVEVDFQGLILRNNPILILDFLIPKDYAVKLALGELCNFPLFNVLSLEVQTIRKACSKTTKMNSSLGVRVQTTEI